MEHTPETIPDCWRCRLNAAAPELLEALEEALAALLSAILFIEGVFPEPRGDILNQELTSYRLREVKARATIKAAKGDA